MSPEEYDAWYRTPRGEWIGELEYRLLRKLLAIASGETLIDVGCGTGYFTRRFARDDCRVTGIDVDLPSLRVARDRRAAGEHYLCADARGLPFKDGEFDCCVSVTALCFIPDEEAALAEMFRVTRRRLVLGLLNRNSVLYLQKGLHGGRGAYRGAHWHTAREVRELLSPMPCRAPRLEFALFSPGAGPISRLAELALPRSLACGAFLAACADLTPGQPPIESSR